jgi:tripartite-type tricarboxylate transporter receptor subunit TctC
MFPTFMRRTLLRGFTAIVASAFAQPLLAADVDFTGKTITLIVTSNTGGGTDNMTRLMGRFLREYLPGKPAVVYQNIPGAGGIKALNYFVQQVKPDGLTSVVGSGSNLNPTLTRTSAVQYDTKKLLMYGGFPAPSGVLMLRKNAVSRFYNKAETSAVMGGEHTLRAADQVAVWGPAYLGWNVRWVMGYPGSNDIILAALRGEVDLVETYERSLISRITQTGEFTFPVQIGDWRNGKFVPSASFPEVPVFSDLVKPNLKTEEEIKAYEAWETLVQAGKWAALPPNTPVEIVNAYRKAFESMIADKRFLAEAPSVLGEGFVTITGDEMQQVAIRSDSISDASMKFLDRLRERVGIRIEATNR